MRSALARLRRGALWALVLAVIALAGAAAFIFSGVYNVAATSQHTVPVYWAIEMTMRQSVHARSALEPVPDFSSPDMMREGGQLYRVHCERCHGGPGVAPEAFALGMTPTPANLTDTARRWTAADIYWVVKHGMKMTGMPAWKYRLSENEIRDIAAFVHGQLRFLSPQEYRALARGSAEPLTSARASAHGAAPDALEGKRAIEQYACATCHFIPGITGATKPVGPPLSGIANRAYIAGVLRNTNENMVAWVMSPQAIDPRSAMPDLSVSERDAHAIAAYLATLTDR